MPHIELRLLGKGDPPLFPDVKPVIHDNNGDWTAVVIESGMSSGQPSVALMVQTDAGLIILETSLLAFQAAARGLMGMAETNFDWRMPP